ncbi:MAG: hypothetical protein LBI62_05885 [Candidatus Accumulibacter sp.]|nr:hypothetical protein [Accumulibacter sp.]
MGFALRPYGVEANEPFRRATFGENEDAGEAVSAGTPRKRNGQALSESEQAEVEKLKATDQKVRQHEQAHVAAGGDLITSGPSYEYTTGPDGQRYAVAGEVGIEVSPGRTPEETLRRAARIRAAALAPADPSPQDRNVAAQAARMQMQAVQEIAMQRQSEDDTTSRIPASSGTSAPGKIPEPTNETFARNDTRVAGAARIGAYRAMMTEAVGARLTPGFFAMA